RRINVICDDNSVTSHVVMHPGWLLPFSPKTDSSQVVGNLLTNETRTGKRRYIYSAAPIRSIALQDSRTISSLYTVLFTGIVSSPSISRCRLRIASTPISYLGI